MATATAANVDEKRSRRLLFMDALYDLAEDNTLQPVSVDAIAARYGWETGEAQRIVAYLENEGMLKFEMGNQATITHAGIVEVEQSDPGPTRRLSISRHQRSFTSPATSATPISSLGSRAR